MLLTVPLLGFADPGADPVSDVVALAKKLGFYERQFHRVALGQVSTHPLLGRCLPVANVLYPVRAKTLLPWRTYTRPIAMDIG